MARVKVQKCPSCSAQLPLRTDDGVVVCEYCGKEAYIEHTRFLHRPVVRSSMSESQQRTVLKIAVAGTAVTILLGVILSIVSSSRTTSTTAETPGEAAIEAPAKEPRKTVWSVIPANVDDDEVEDVVGLYTVYDPNQRYLVGAFSGSTWELVWSTGETVGQRPIIRVVGQRVLVSFPGRGLATYDLRTGKKRLSIDTSDEVTEVCPIEDGSDVWLAVADKMNITVTMADGRIVEARERPAQCPVPEYGCSHRDPDQAPCQAWDSGTKKAPYLYVQEEGRCTKSLGAKCSRKSIEGMQPNMIINRDSKYLAIGVKYPGTALPMIARLEGQQVAWQRLVSSDPKIQLSTAEPIARLSHDAYIGGVTHEAGVLLFSIDLDSGNDNYSRLLPGSNKDSSMQLLVLSGSRIYLKHWRGELEVFERSTGELLGTIGG